MSSQVFRDGLLDGQVAIVTGGGSGLGRTTALELARLGASVVVCGRRSDPLHETVALDDAARMAASVCDIREEDQVQRLVDETIERHGRIDLLVNNAGGQFLSPAEDITPKGFRTVMKLNVEGTWLMTHAVATRAMIPGGGGKIISVTLSPHHGLPGMAHSSAATVPLGRLGEPEEIAWLVTLLASPAGDFFSGSVLTVDGARDNWAGPWPPPFAALDDGRLLAETRRPKPPSTTG